MTVEAMDRRAAGGSLARPVLRPTADEAPRVLILEEDPEIRAAMKALAARLSCAVDAFDDPAAALARIKPGSHHVVILGLPRPGSDDFPMMKAVHQADPMLSVLLAAGGAAIPDAIRAMQHGAEHFMAKPVVESELLFALQRALERQRLRGRTRPPRGDGRERFPTLVGDSRPMRALLDRVALVAQTRSTVLLTGETGTGKERVAEAIHAGSSRASRPFVRVHCAALAETLLESELFGHERGAFTGALTRREGRFKLADGGTLLLDEIGEISPAIQVKLLRVLQEREFERVGGCETLSVDVRIIAATNRDLRAMVAAGTFRADLYYRLNVVTLEVPPLRERRADIPLLVEHHLARLARDFGLAMPTVTSEAMRLLTRHDWPGNVRELENVLERALVLSRGAPITAAELEPHFVPAPARDALVSVPGATFAEIERHAILSTYEACGRSPQRTAEVLGLSLRTIHYRLREYEGRAGRRRVRAVARAE